MMKTLERMFVLSCSVSAAMLGVGCPGAAPEISGEKGAISTAQSRWVRAIAPTSLALLEAPAKIVAEEIAEGAVTVPFPARVEAIRVAAGDEVAAGTPIADVVMPELNRAAATLESIDDQLALVEARLTELTKLEAERLVRAEELFELRSARGRLAADRAQAEAVMRSSGSSPARAGSILRTGRMTLVAPVAGVVTRVDARLGSFVPEGTVLVELLGAKRVRVEATLTGRLPEGATIELVLTNGDTHLLGPVPVGSVVDPATGQTKIWLSLAEPMPLPVGLRGRLRVLPQKGTLVQIPSAAIVRHDDETYVFVVENDVPVRHVVEVVTDSGTSALISGPVPLGSTVVVDPAESETAP